MLCWEFKAQCTISELNVSSMYNFRLSVLSHFQYTEGLLWPECFHFVSEFMIILTPNFVFDFTCSQLKSKLY